MSDTQRNFLIVIIIALVVMVSSPAMMGAAIVSSLVGLAFTVLIIWWLALLYSRNSGTIANIPTAPRLVLQASAAILGVALITGLIMFPFLPFPFGWSQIYPVIFWPLVIACAFGIWWGWQHRTSKW